MKTNHIIKVIALGVAGVIFTINGAVAGSSGPNSYRHALAVGSKARTALATGYTDRTSSAADRTTVIVPGMKEPSHSLSVSRTEPHKRVDDRQPSKLASWSESFFGRLFKRSSEAPHTREAFMPSEKIHQPLIVTDDREESAS